MAGWAKGQSGDRSGAPNSGGDKVNKVLISTGSVFPRFLFTEMLRKRVFPGYGDFRRSLIYMCIYYDYILVLLAIKLNCKSSASK